MKDHKNFDIYVKRPQQNKKRSKAPKTQKKI